MSPVKKLIIQTALRPMFVFADGEISKVANFDEFFDKMKSIELGKETLLYINRGPGSYSGIRTGISYVMGLLHGKMIMKNNTRSFTSFDLIAATKEPQQVSRIYIKAWPRMVTNKLEGSKGYHSFNGEFSYGTEPAENNDYLIYSEEKLEDITGVKLFSATGPVEVATTENCETLSSISKFSENLEPLYINPVHIT